MSLSVLVTGASGFLGQAVVHELLTRGIHVKALTRTAWPFADHPNLTRVTGDIRDLASLEAAVAGVSHIVHLAAMKNDERSSEAVNVHGASVLADAARIAGVRRIIHVSTQSVKLSKRGTYGETKRKAEEVLEASHLPVVTLRLSVVYGTKTDGILGTIARYAKLPIVPMIGKGAVTFHPIHRDDAANIIAEALLLTQIDGRTYDIGGPTKISLQEMTTDILSALHLHRRILHLPLSLCMLCARVGKLIGISPITMSNVLGSAENVPMDLRMQEQDFGMVHCRTWEEGLRELYGNKRMPLEQEAAVLLTYSLSRLGQWKPTEKDVSAYVDACTTHQLTDALDQRILRSKRKLALLDAATALCAPTSALQKKLTIAAAIAETSPASAPLLLPKERHPIIVLLLIIDYGWSAAWRLCAALPYIVIRPLRTRYVGTV